MWNRLVFPFPPHLTANLGNKTLPRAAGPYLAAELLPPVAAGGMRASTRNAIIAIYITTEDKNNNTSKPTTPTSMIYVGFLVFFRFMQQTSTIIRKNPVSGKSAQSNRRFLNENPIGKCRLRSTGSAPCSRSPRGYEKRLLKEIYIYINKSVPG